MAGEQVLRGAAAAVGDERRAGRPAVRRAGPRRGARLRRPTPPSWRCIAEIVRRLDGLPLAIELAAARLHTPRRRRGRRRARPPLRAAVVRATARRPATARWARRCRGRSGCSTRTCSETFADLSVFAGSFTAADAAAVCGVDAGGDGRGAGPARRALAGDAGARTAGTCCSRRCGRSAPSSSPPTAGPRPSPSATPATTSTGSSDADARLLRAGRAGDRRDRRRAPGAARRPRLAARPRRGRARRPARRRAARLRLPAAAPRRAGVGRAGRRRRPATTAARWRRRCGWSPPTPRGWPATSPRPVCAAPRALAIGRARRRRSAAEVAHRAGQPRSCSRAASTRPSAWYRRAAAAAADDPAERR